jgi:hypothetical protein
MDPCAVGLCQEKNRPDRCEVHFIRNHCALDPAASRTELPPRPPATTPTPEPLTLRPFEVQGHSDDGRIDWHHKDGEFLSREVVEAELTRLGIPYIILES